MSTFTKNYYHPKNDEIFLTLRWEQGYKNVEVFHGDELIRTITSRSELIKGVTWVDDVLGKISVKLSTDRPMKIELKVKRKKFKTVNLKKKKESYNVSAVTWLFGSVGFFSLKGVIDIVDDSVNFLSSPVVIFILAMTTIFALCYILTAVLIKTYPQMFYLSTTMYIISTILVFAELFDIDLIGLGFFMAPYHYPMIIVIFTLVFRVAFCLMLLYQFKGVRNEIEARRNKKNVAEILD